MFSKILIAARGEIALRIIRACREMGIRTVAVYSEVDKDSLHVRFADEAVCIGRARPSESYLNIPAIISAAEVTDVEAIHPGYGFLSENPHFAEVCQSCQIKFIGPSPETMRLAGDKLAARVTMKKAGLPIIPGSLSSVKDKDEALKIAKQIRYPVIIKAAAGGGGRGMRIAHSDIRLVSALLAAQAEAEAAFGNSDIYLEKYIEKPRHVEFQILADQYGRIVQLGERDCTIQRRHQKLIEESPSPALNSKLRRKMGDAAIRAAKVTGYANAGTIEFLLDEKGNFYFIEVNARIQVEHPVTELVTGIDLIRQQIMIAAGEKLEFGQDQVKPRAWAIECRINAEDPEDNFHPSPGRILSYNVPGGYGVRVDSSAYAGYEITSYYDSMIAKLLTWGKNRTEAIMRMRRALDEYVIGPVKTTVPLYRQIFDDADFIKGNYYTDYIDRFVERKE